MKIIVTIILAISLLIPLSLLSQVRKNKQDTTKTDLSIRLYKTTEEYRSTQSGTISSKTKYEFLYKGKTSPVDYYGKNLARVMKGNGSALEQMRLYKNKKDYMGISLLTATGLLVWGTIDYFKNDEPNYLIAGGVAVASLTTWLFSTSLEKNIERAVNIYNEDLADIHRNDSKLLIGFKPLTDTKLQGFKLYPGISIAMTF